MGFFSLSLLSNIGSAQTLKAVGEEDFKERTPFSVPRASCLQDNVLFFLEFSSLSLSFADLFSSHFIRMSLLRQTH